MNATLPDLRTLLRFHRDMAALHRANGQRDKARAAQRRAETVSHALRDMRRANFGG
jgi:hypothetical protein